MFFCSFFFFCFHGPSPVVRDASADWREREGGMMLTRSHDHLFSLISSQLPDAEDGWTKERIDTQEKRSYSVHLIVAYSFSIGDGMAETDGWTRGEKSAHMEAGTGISVLDGSLLLPFLTPWCRSSLLPAELSVKPPLAHTRNKIALLIRADASRNEGAQPPLALSCAL